MKTPEIVVAADEPADAGGERAGDELDMVWVSDFWNDRWRGYDGFDEGKEFFLDQTSNLCVCQLECGISQHSNVFI